MILFGKTAKKVLARIDTLEAQVSERDTRIEALEREVVRIITSEQEQKKEGVAIVSVPSEEGETWLKPRPTP